MSKKSKTIFIKASEDQRLVCEDYAISGDALQILPSERIYLYEYIMSKYPNHKIINANLELSTLEWQIEIIEKEEA